MLELDDVLARFLRCEYAKLSAEEAGAFAQLLKYDDRVIHGWIMGYDAPASVAMRSLVGKVRQMGV
jgi:succinate dehydrogenase flavin-adding protein (antitoxin of CptAB toxin-antitoxin module)